MNRNLNILMVEDSPYDAELIQRELKKGGIKFTARIVQNKEDYEKALDDFFPDIILTDHQLPAFSSVEALAIAKIRKPEIPFILITGTVSEEFAVSIMRDGADDYLLKSRIVRLPSAIEQALKLKKAETERELAMQQLKSKNEELSLLIYKCSHDLRAPVSTTLGFLNLIEKSENQNELNSYLPRIRESMNRLDRILIDLIQANQITQKQRTSAAVDIEKLIKKNLDVLQDLPKFKTLNISVTVNLTQDFYCDEQILSSVIRNLLENAIQHQVKEQGGMLEVIVEEKQNRIKIQIKDNGPGIPTESLPKIFDMFYRGTQENPGSGLGLYIVTKGVERLNGSILVQSAPGAGTVFKMQFPISQE
jgi:signal transduction histidine kinase